MKITDIRAIPISVPTDSLLSALGVFPTYDYGLVLVQTDEGIEGLGEISMLWDGNGHVQCQFVNEYFKPLLLGEDPFSINRCLRKMDTLVEAAHSARAGIEMALFDIVGKALNTPVYNLLGGKSRDGVILSRSIHMGKPEEMAERAAKYVSEGYSCVKVKVGLDSKSDFEAVSAVRKAIGPDILLRVDANMGWRTTKDAIRNIKRLEDFNLHSVEQPIPPGNLGELKLIRDSVDTPIMADESIWGPKDAWNILQEGAIDMINLYVAESGGLTNCALIFRMAEMVGVPCVIGAMPEFGIGTSAAIHLGISMTNLNDPCDACGSLYQITDIVNEQFTVKDGMIFPLEGPGLGVTINWKAIEKYSHVERRTTR